MWLLDLPGMTGKGSGPLDLLNCFVLLMILFVVVLLISFNCFMFLLNLFSWWSSWCSVPSDLNFVVVLLISCSFWSYDLIFVMLLSIFYVLSQWFSLILCYFEEITFESILHPTSRCTYIYLIIKMPMYLAFWLMSYMSDTKGKHNFDKKI